MKPACFDSERQWGFWQAANAVTKTPLTPTTHCQDCTVAYQRQMIAEGRCEQPTYSFDQISEVSVEHPQNPQ